MTRTIGILLLTLASASHSASNEPARVAQRYRLLINSELVDYSGSGGTRKEQTVAVSRRLGSTSLTLTGSAASGRVGENHRSGAAISLDASHDWSPLTATRTTVAFGSNSALFARRTLMQEVSLKPARGLLVTAGARTSHYSDGDDVLGLSLGGAYYFRGGLASYRVTQYHGSGSRWQTGHLASLRLNDPSGQGSTQLWLGAGGNLRETDASLNSTGGHFRSIALRRVQPLVGTLALSLAAERDWYSNDGHNFTAFRPSVGFVINQ